MSNIVDTTNKSAFLYQESIAHQIIKICEPLVRYLGIYRFGYFKYFQDSTFLTLLNGFYEYQKKYFDNLIPHGHVSVRIDNEYLNDNMRNKRGYIYWPIQPISQDPYLSLNYEYNVWNGCALYDKHKEYTEVFSFAFNKTSDEKTNFFINNLTLLENFCSYFKVLAKDIIDCADKSKLAKFKHEMPQKFFLQDPDTIQQKDLNFLKYLDRLKLNRTTNSNISKKEFECIELLAHGKTMKETGKSLNISPRTVERYVENAKNKTGCNFKSQIIDLYWSS